MLKALAILTVLFAAAQTPVPSRQAPNNSTQASKGISLPPNPSKTTPVAPPSPDNPKSDKERPIAVTSLPTVTVDRNWLDYATFGVGVIVLIVGLFGVRYAKRTLDAIADQATTLHEHAGHLRELADAAKDNSVAAKDNAAAALKQANHIVASERGWMIPQITQPELADVINAQDHIDEWLLPIEIILSNHGKTPAIAIRGLAEFSSERTENRTALSLKPILPQTPTYTKPVNVYAPGSVYIRGSNTQMYLAIPKEFLVAERTPWIMGQKCLCVKGFIEYKDVFENVRVTRFCYAYQIVSEAGALANALTLKPTIPPEFRKAGPDAYNEIT